MTDTIHDGEGMTAFTIRRIRNEIIEECAKVAEAHVGTANDPNYDEACRDIIAAIRDKLKR